MIIDELLLLALAGGLATALFTAPVGCFVVWRRMAFYGDALAHSTILGIAISLLFTLSTMAGVLIVALLVAALMLAMERVSALSPDTLLGVLTHSLLALGILALAFTDATQVRIYEFLFGDILAIGWQDVWLLLGVAVLVWGVLLPQWQKMLLATLHPDLAAAEGVPVARCRFIFMLLLTLVVAAGVHFMGVLMVSALLVIPPAVARCFSRSPGAMFAGAVLVSLLAVAAGIFGAFAYDLPAAPAIAAAAGVLFLLGLVLSGGKKR